MRIKYDLRYIVTNLTDSFDSINSVHLFGSRAYKTSSLRSDIDLLITSEKPIPSIKIFNWIDENYPIVDIFKSIDDKSAESAANGSVISANTSLVKELNAIELWNKTDKLNEDFTDWIQELAKGVSIEPTFARIPYNLNQAIKDFDNILFENDFPNTNLGIEWDVIGQRLITKVSTALEFLSKWNGTSGTFNKIKLSNEKDFQNLCELIIKPWLPDTQRETTAARFDSQSKNIDFSIELDKILIEAKHIKDANTEAKAIKEIEGITKFYLSNTNVKLLMFWVLVEPSYDLDKALLEKTFTSKNENTFVITKIYENTLNE